MVFVPASLILANNYQPLIWALCTHGVCMFFRVPMKIMTISIMLLLSGCSTTKSSHIACDFVGGAAGNTIERHGNKGNSDMHGNIVRNNQNSDFFEGVLNILGGMFTRAVSDKENEPCT